MKRRTARIVRRGERREIALALAGDEGELTPLDIARAAEVDRLAAANAAVERYEKYLWR